MSQPYIGEIRMFSGTFAPRNWVLCAGQLMAISGNESLFSLLGTAYGGDGRTTFAVPDLRSRIPVGDGQGPTLSNRVQGQRYGTEMVTLTNTELPNHIHSAQASETPADSKDPDSSRTLATLTPDAVYEVYDPGTMSARLRNFPTQYLGTAGGNQSHQNRMPVMCVNFIMATQGLYPPRN